MLEDTLDDVREAAEGLLNAEGRSVGHVLLGGGGDGGLRLVGYGAGDTGDP